MSPHEFRAFLEDLTEDCTDTAIALCRLEELTEDLLAQAIECEWLYADRAEEIWQHARGYVCVCCFHCGGEYYVPRAYEFGPNFCDRCFCAGWPDAYPEVIE